MNPDDANKLAGLFTECMETGAVPDGLFAADVFCDFTMPKWRLQAQGIERVVALRAGHPGPGKVPRWRCDPTESGSVLEFEERWAQDGKDWYSREMVRADAPKGKISEFSVYCTGDWDADHRKARVCCYTPAPMIHSVVSMRPAPTHRQASTRAVRSKLSMRFPVPLPERSVQEDHP